MHSRLAAPHRPQADPPGRHTDPRLVPPQKSTCPQTELSRPAGHADAQLQRLPAAGPAGEGDDRVAGPAQRDGSAHSPADADPADDDRQAAPGGAQQDPGQHFAGDPGARQVAAAPRYVLSDAANTLCVCVAGWGILWDAWGKMFGKSGSWLFWLFLVDRGSCWLSL